MVVWNVPPGSVEQTRPSAGVRNFEVRFRFGTWSDSGLEDPTVALSQVAKEAEEFFRWRLARIGIEAQTLQEVTRGQRFRFWCRRFVPGMRARPWEGWVQVHGCKPQYPKGRP